MIFKEINICELLEKYSAEQLFKQHSEEIKDKPGIVYSPNWELVYKMEELGLYKFYGLLKDNKLLAYSGVFIGSSPWYKDNVLFQIESMYAIPCKNRVINLLRLIDGLVNIAPVGAVVSFILHKNYEGERLAAILNKKYGCELNTSSYEFIKGE